MKDIFGFFRRAGGAPSADMAQAISEPVIVAPKAHNEEPDDGFVEWRRSRTRGGIEKREHNEFYEQYSVYGLDDQGRLCCRLYHRYPEEEREFGMSYSRALSFDEFNSRLLGELDRGDLTLGDYIECVSRAEALSPGEERPDIPIAREIDEADEQALRSFCDKLDNLKNKTGRSAQGVFRCDSESAVMGESLTMMFRRPLRYDAFDKEDPAVKRERVEYYDIEDIWIMGVCNRLKENGAKIDIISLSSAWVMDGKSVYLMTVEGLPGIEGRLLLAIAESTAISRFGFFSLDPTAVGR